MECSKYSLFDAVDNLKWRDSCEGGRNVKERERRKISYITSVAIEGEPCVPNILTDATSRVIITSVIGTHNLLGILVKYI